MLECADRPVRDYLQLYIQLLLRNDALWAKVLRHQPEEAQAALMADFRAKPPLAAIGYPRTASHDRVWSVILLDETPLPQPMGFVMNIDDAGREEIGIAGDQRLMLWAVADNWEVARRDAVLIKAGMLLGRNVFTRQYHQEGYSYGGMSDVLPLAPYLPSTLVARSQTWIFANVSDVLLSEDDLFDPDELISGPAFVGVAGTDMGDGHTGQVVPITS